MRQAPVRRGMPPVRMLATALACALGLMGAAAAGAQAHSPHRAGDGHRNPRADRLLARGVLTWRGSARATRRIGGRRVRAETHLDRNLVRIPRSARAAGVATDSLAATWCGLPSATDRPNPLNSAPQIKVVYAHPADVPSHLSQYADLIQSAMRTAAQVVEARSGGTRTLRLDVGSSCDDGGGPWRLDITEVTLPGTKASYLASGKIDTAAMRAQIGLAPGDTNMLIWGDGLGAPGGPLGVGQTFLDDRAGAVNVNNAGGRDALVLGRGGSQFLSDDPSRSWEPASVALHEVTHTLGAVMNGAPHSSHAGHCTDEWDIMCYADDGPGNPKSGSGLTFPCAGSAAAEVYDCGGDDYFNPAPDPGSWLAGHWNVAFSPFLCPQARCFSALAPPKASVSPTAATLDLYEPLTVDATEISDVDGPAPEFGWDVPDALNAQTTTDGRRLRAVWARTGAQRAALIVVDSDGNLTEAPIAVTVVNRPPRASISVPGAASVGAEALITAGDADGRPVGQYQWDLDGVPGFERNTGANAWVSMTFATPGQHTVAVRVTDTGGASDEASAALTVAPSAGGTPTAPAGPADRPAAAAPRVDVRLASRLSRAALRRTLLVRVRSSVAGRLSVRLGVRRDGSEPLVVRKLTVRAGEWTALRVRLPRRSGSLRRARTLRVTVVAPAGASGALAVPIR